MIVIKTKHDRAYFSRRSVFFFAEAGEKTKKIEIKPPWVRVKYRFVNSHHVVTTAGVSKFFTLLALAAMCLRDLNIKCTFTWRSKTSWHSSFVIRHFALSTWERTNIADKHIKTPSLAVSLLKLKNLDLQCPKFVEDGRKNRVREPSSEWKQSGRVLQVLLPFLQEG